MLRLLHLVLLIMGNVLVSSLVQAANPEEFTFKFDNEPLIVGTTHSYRLLAIDKLYVVGDATGSEYAFIGKIVDPVAPALDVKFAGPNQFQPFAWETTNPAGMVIVRETTASGVQLEGHNILVCGNYQHAAGSGGVDTGYFFSTPNHLADVEDGIRVRTAHSCRPRHRKSPVASSFVLHAHVHRVLIQ